MIYFGFTHCPDICPEELDKMGEAVEVIDRDRQERVLPLFVSVDPARDSVAQVKKYVAGKCGSSSRKVNESCAFTDNQTSILAWLA